MLIPLYESTGAGVSANWPQDFFTELAKEQTVFTEKGATTRIRGRYAPTKAPVTQTIKTTLNGVVTFYIFVMDEASLVEVSQYVKGVAQKAGYKFVKPTELYNAKKQVSCNYSKERQSMVIAVY